MKIKATVFTISALFLLAISLNAGMLNLDKLHITAKSEDTSAVKLYQNHPNPFNPETVIKFSLPKEEFVSLKVYDILGSVVSVLVNEILPQGEHDKFFSASNLPSGLYLFELKTKDFSTIKKMVLIR